MTPSTLACDVLPEPVSLPRWTPQPHLMTAFSFETTLPVRYQDLDALGHVNNAVYATYLEQARIEYFIDELGLDVDAISTVVAHLELDFDAPVTDARKVTVRVGPTDIGEKSFTLGYEILDGETVSARGETVLVWIDRAAGTSEPIPASIRETLAGDLVEPTV